MQFAFGNRFCGFFRRRTLDLSRFDRRLLVTLHCFLPRDFFNRLGGNEPDFCGMLRHRNRVSGEDKAAAGCSNDLGEVFDLPDPARIPRNIANVHREHTAGMLFDDLPVHLGIVLSAVADQHERQVAVEREHISDQVLLVILSLAGQWAFPGNAPLSQEQDRADRNPVQSEELVQHVVDAPWGS